MGVWNNEHMTDKPKAKPWRHHKRLTPDMKKAIKKIMAEGYSFPEIADMIANYALILLDPAYKWSYVWTLTEFLTRRDGTTKDSPLKCVTYFHPENFQPDRYLTKAAIQRKEMESFENEAEEVF